MAGITGGQRFGQWVTIGEEALGGGGNGEVWRVHGDDGRLGAIKVLTQREGSEGVYRLGRFRDEIAFLWKHPGFPGILPLADSHLSDDPGELSWYVMPLAFPIVQALGPDPDPGVVVATLAEIAKTLAALAAEGTWHRDIKPDNLFLLDDAWVVGDFGLVKYPEKAPLTEHGRKLGPTDYMAPEMRQDADTAAAEPADVWALAKTLWVLLTGQSLPLPGSHRPDDEAHALTTRISFGRAAELDLLLEQATQIQPGERITMAAMARELLACASPPPEATPSADLPELGARARALTDRSRRLVALERSRRDLITSAGKELEQITRDAGAELAELLGFDLFQMENGYLALQELGTLNFAPDSQLSYGIRLIAPGGHPKAFVELATGMRILRENELASFAALLNVIGAYDQGLHHTSQIWHAAYTDIPVASAQQAQTLSAIKAGFTTSFDAAARTVIEILAQPSP